MKHILIVVIIALIASLTWNFILREKNHKLKETSHDVYKLSENVLEQSNRLNAKFIIESDSFQLIIDSLTSLKSKTAIINHFKIVEKQKLVTIIDSTKEPIIFDPEYQLLNCMYDSVSQENSLNNRLVEAQSHYILTLRDRVDSFKLLNSSLSVDNKILQHKIKTYRFITATSSILLLTVLLL